MKTVELLERIFEIKRLLTPPAQNDPKPALSKRALKRRAAKAEANEAEGQKSKKTVDEDQIAANRAEGQKQLNTLQNEILKEKGEQGLEYLKKILDSNYNINLEDDELIANLPPFCNVQLFRKLLPLCRLAFLYEDNGIAEDHATKLATIFNDEEGVFQYLIRFEKLTPRAHLLHDGCLFELPEAGNCNFEYWKRKSLQKGTNGINLLNPRFRKLLPYAPEVESLLRERSRQENVAQLEIDGIKKDISAIGKKYKKVEQTPIPNPTEEQKNKRREELSKLSEERSNLLLKLSECCSGLSLEETDLIVWDAFYELYQSKKGDAYKILTKHGISPRNQEFFFKLEPNNDDIKVPNILINGADIDHKGLYLKKLDIMTTEGRAIAACLGKITSCCQFLGGQGHDCTLHGIESSDDGFYVLCRGDASKPQLNDIIIAQTWAWRGENGALVLDSIEVTPSLNEMDKNKVIDIFRFFALELCSDPNFAHYNIHTVNTGSRSGITREVACQNYSAQKEFHQDYHNYSDSMIQLILGNSDLPYLFYGAQSSALLKNKIEAATNIFLKENLSLALPFKENQHIQGAISFAISTSSELFLETLRNHAGERRQELESLIQVNRQYIINLNKGIIDFESLKKGAYINAKDKSGQNGLFVSIENNNMDVAKELIALNIDVDATDKTGNKALPFAFNRLYRYWYSQEFKTEWLSILSKNFDLNAKNNNGHTPLGIAILNNDITMIKLLLAQGANIDLLQGRSNKPAIQLAIEEGNKDIIHLFIKQGARLDIISSLGATLLISAITSDNNDLENIIEILLKNCDNLFHRDHFGKTALHYCFEKDRVTYIPLIIEYCAQQDLLRFIINRTKNGDTLLHQCICNDPQDMRKSINHIELLLNKLTPEQLIQVILLKGKNDLPLILCAAQKDPKAFDIFLRKVLALKDEKKLRAILFSDSLVDGLFGRTINIEVYKIMFDVLAKDTLKGFVNKPGNFVLHHVAKNSQLLANYLSLYDSDEEKIEAIRKKNHEGRSVLACSVNNLASFKIALTSCQNNAGIIVIEEPSILVAAVNNRDVFDMILGLYPTQESRDKALRELLQIDGSNRFWFDIEKAPEIFQLILKAYTNEERGIVINQKKVKETIAHICLNNNDTTLLKELLTELSEKDKITFLTTREKNTVYLLKGYKNLLEILMIKPDGIDIVLEIFIEHEHCDILINALKAIPNNEEKLAIIQKLRPIFSKFSIEKHAKIIKEFGSNELLSFRNIIFYLKIYADNINSKIEAISDIWPLSQLTVYKSYVHDYTRDKLISLVENNEASLNEIIECLPVHFFCDCVREKKFSFQLNINIIIDILSNRCKDLPEKLMVIQTLIGIISALSIEEHAKIINILAIERDLLSSYLRQYAEYIKLSINTDEDIINLFKLIGNIHENSKTMLYSSVKDKLVEVISKQETIDILRNINRPINDQLLCDMDSFLEKFTKAYNLQRSNKWFSFFRSNFPSQHLNGPITENFLKVKSHAQECADSSTRECLDIMRSNSKK